MGLVIQRLEAAPRHRIGDRGEVVALVDSMIGASKVDVHINRLTAGGPPGRYHFHPHSENIYIITRGKGTFVADEQSFVLSKDDVVFIPPGIKHSLTADITEGLDLIEIFAPVPVETVWLD